MTEFHWKFILMYPLIFLPAFLLATRHHSSFPLDSVVIKFNPDHIFTPYFCKVSFNTLCSQMDLFSAVMISSHISQAKCLTYFFLCPCELHTPMYPHHIY